MLHFLSRHLNLLGCSFYSADIVFSTAHKSKGLEFNTVKLTDDYLEYHDNLGQSNSFCKPFVVNYYTYNFHLYEVISFSPISHAALYPISPLPLLLPPAALRPDERNLLYVAATRAKKQLIISETLLDVLHKAKVSLSGGGFQSLLPAQYTIDHSSYYIPAQL